MKKINEISIKNIRELYKEIEILSDYTIVWGTDRYVIYVIEPVNVLGLSHERRQDIFIKYRQLVTIFGTCKIIYVSDCISFEEQIELCKKRLNDITSQKLKEAINCYVSQLESLDKSLMHRGKFYLICNKQLQLMENSNVFTEIGIKLEEIKDKETLKRVIERIIKKGRI